MEFVLLINYCSAVAGAGKTHTLVDLASRLVDEGQNVLIVQPTKALIDETASKFDGVHCVVLHGDTVPHETIKKLMHSFIDPYPEAHVVLTTWSAFEQVSYINRAEDWHIFIDEIPQVHVYENLKAKRTHTLLTDHIRTISEGPTYSLVISENDGELRKIIDGAREDDVLKPFADIAKRIRSENWASYVEEAAYRDLIEGRKSELRVFSLLKPAVLAGFRSTTILGANFEESLLYGLWRQQGVAFRVHEELTQGLRFQSHEGGQLIRILYAFDEDWSKTFRNRNSDIAMSRLVEAVKGEFGDRSFLWVANKDVSDGVFVGTNGLRLPNAPHGLNQYQWDYDNVAFLSALNLRTEHFKFLESRGLNSDLVRTATYKHVVYQAVMRCSIRDHENRRPKTIIVPDCSTAIWLQGLFAGSVVEQMDIKLDGVIKNKRSGRPRKHGSTNDRRIAYRQCLKAGLDRFNDYVKPDDKQGLDRSNTKSCDEISFIEDLNNTKSDDKDILNSRRHGILWGHKKSKTQLKMIDGLTHNQFIDHLRIFHRNKFDMKEDNKLISNAYFQKIEGMETERGNKNIQFINGIWLDFDHGNLRHTDFKNIFPKIRIVAFNTWSTAPDKIRWRAYIPTIRVMTPEEYRVLTAMIVSGVQEAGYWLNAIDPNDPSKKAHGIDKGKLGPASLFYLPCQAGDGESSFFRDYKKRRGILDPVEWLEAARRYPIQSNSLALIEPVNDSVDIVIDDNDPAIQHWRTVGVLPGHGDAGMFGLYRELKAKGANREQLAMVLRRESGLANSPVDRIRQVERLIGGS